MTKGVPVFVLLTLFSASVLPAAAEEEATDKETEETGEVSYYRDIRPLFQQHCQGCHQPAQNRGSYVMTGYADLFKLGDTGEKPIEPGHPEKSYLVSQISPREGKPPAMPKNRSPLTEQQVALITNWIAQGARDDTPASARDPIDADHPPIYHLPPVITSLDFSPDGKLLAVSGHHEVLLHKMEGSAPGGTPVARLVGLAERIQSLAFSPDGSLLAVAGGSPGRFGEIQVWDVARKRLRISHTVTYDTLYGVSWSHDGSKIAFGCADNSVRAIDAATGEQVLFQGAHNDWVLDTVFSRDSTYLVSVGRDRTMKLTHVATQRFIDNITSITPGALKGGLMAVDRNPEKNDKKVKSTAKGTDMSEKWYDELIVGGADGTPRLYKMHRTTKRVIGDDANKIRVYPPMPGRIFALQFSPDGSQFAAGSSDQGKGAVWIYNTKDGKVAARLQPGGVGDASVPIDTKVGPIYTVDYSPDGNVLACAGFDGTVLLVDPKTGKVTRQFIPVPLQAEPRTQRSGVSGLPGAADK
jgi:WD40 repeat protein/mono/diheme cytochrome c family protein